MDPLEPRVVDGHMDNGMCVAARVVEALQLSRSAGIAAGSETCTLRTRTAPCRQVPGLSRVAGGSICQARQTTCLWNSETTRAGTPV